MNQLKIHLIIIFLIRFNSSIAFKSEIQAMKLEPKDLAITRLERIARKNNVANSKFINSGRFFSAMKSPKIIEENQISFENSRHSFNNNLASISSSNSNNVLFFTPRKTRDPHRFQSCSASKSIVTLEESKRIKQINQSYTPSALTGALLNNNTGGYFGINGLDSPKIQSANKLNSVHYDSNKKSQGGFTEFFNFLSSDGFLEPIRETHAKEVDNDQMYSKQDLKNCRILYHFKMILLIIICI